MVTNRSLGAFVSSAGGLKNAVINGEKLGVNTIMLHPSAPQRWRTKPFEQDNIDEFNDVQKDSIVMNVYFHGIYLTNLANPDKQKFHLGKVALVHYLNLAEKVAANGVVFHVGSFKDNDPDVGFKQIIHGINWIMRESYSKTPILMLEAAAGAGHVVGAKFEDLKRIRDGIDYPERVYYCLDTAHLFGSGYDIVNDLEGVVEDADRILGLDNIKCVHFNDSKVELGSKKDRHENIGEGLIGEKAMRAFLNHPKLKHLPYIMETPGLKSFDTAVQQVQTLMSWAELD